MPPARRSKPAPRQVLQSPNGKTPQTRGGLPDATARVSAHEPAMPVAVPPAPPAIVQAVPSAQPSRFMRRLFHWHPSQHHHAHHHRKGRIAHHAPPRVGAPPARLAALWAPPFRTPVAPPVPAGRCHGEDALGVSVPKRLRHACTGGHGRNGAGRP